MQKRLGFLGGLLAVATLGLACGEEGDGSSVDCPVGQTACDSQCVTLETNSLHCGGCDRACVTGSQCMAGGCVCQVGLTACGNVCANLGTDGANCGACGNACLADEVCSAGSCRASCPVGSTQCDSSCVNTDTDPSNCGGCGTACAAGEACVNGLCGCPAGQQECSGSCVDTLTDPSNCGTCGNVCTDGATCTSGLCTGGTPSGSGGGSSTGSGGASSTGTGGSGAVDDLEPFSFFITSLESLRTLSGNQDGFGGDFRYGEATGLAGADKICAEIAEMSMPGSSAKQWRAFLSVTSGPDGQPVNAIDRVGSGPWYDRLGRVLAMTVDDLQNTRPNNADPEIVDDLPNEYGVPNSNPDGTGSVDNHHMLTGSDTNGELYTNDQGDTCNDWTSAVGNTGQPRCGMSFPRNMGGGGMGDEGSHWISGYTANGCAPGVSLTQDGAGDRNILTVGEGGGYGGFYCFALTP